LIIEFHKDNYVFKKVLLTKSNNSKSGAKTEIYPLNTPEKKKNGKKKTPDRRLSQVQDLKREEMF